MLTDRKLLVVVAAIMVVVVDAIVPVVRIVQAVEEDLKAS